MKGFKLSECIAPVGRNRQMILVLLMSDSIWERLPLIIQATDRGFIQADVQLKPVTVSVLILRTTSQTLRNMLICGRGR